MKKIITASEIHSVTYCPKSLENDINAIDIHEDAEILMNNGSIAHSNQNNELNDSRCYISTHIYGEHHFITKQLRLFRDYYLSKSIFGKSLIQLYYFISPYMINTIGNNKKFVNLSRKIIHKILRRNR